METKLNLAQQKHAFTNRKKRTATQARKLKLRLVAFYDIQPGNGAGLLYSERKTYLRDEISKEKVKKKRQVGKYTV